VLVLQDFKTGHITMSSPRSMFIAQIAGAVMGASLFFPPCAATGLWLDELFLALNPRITPLKA